MEPHLFSTPAAAAVLLVSGSSCSTAPPSTPSSSWHLPFMRLLRKVSPPHNPPPSSPHTHRCDPSGTQASHSVPLFFPSGHRECLELLLLYGAHIDTEHPVDGTPLYSACLAQAAACVGLLLLSGNSKKESQTFMSHRKRESQK